jgi:hypothetical protein
MKVPSMAANGISKSLGIRSSIRADFGIVYDRVGESLVHTFEKQSLQFRWEVFNLSNSVRFDVQAGLISGALGLGSGGSFGNYSGLLTNPRIMQFALRYEF